ncbi:uncharacterized protein ZBIST_3169 [Zygosaccharomyces bailii]|nr:uncharacterized protein ZBIST_3169 [Zygosaccharomyces bailii]
MLSLPLSWQFSAALQAFQTPLGPPGRGLLHAEKLYRRIPRDSAGSDTGGEGGKKRPQTLRPSLVPPASKLSPPTLPDHAHHRPHQMTSP